MAGTGLEDTVLSEINWSRRDRSKIREEEVPAVFHHGRGKQPSSGAAVRGRDLRHGVCVWRWGALETDGVWVAF